MSDDVAIRVVGVSKSFKLPHEKSGSIKNALLGWRKRKRGYETQQVLNDVSFEIKKGEFFGIVGRNGSGKSTLLKLISQIYTPDKGHIQVNGKLTPFIELGVGFNPELSGRDNIYLNGALLGFNRQEMDAMYDEIVAFAELERFMDQKLKNYSSGMQVRLAFSIAIRANSDILVLDEVLAVGDEAFQRKCYDYFSQLKIAKKTVILVTHGMENVTRFCDRAMLVSEGSINYIGDPRKAARLYEEINLDEPRRQSKKTKEKASVNKPDIEIGIVAVNQEGGQVDGFTAEDRVCLQAKIESSKTLKDVFMGLSIHKPNGEAIFVKTTEQQDDMPAVIKPGVPVYVTYNMQNIFGEDTYFVSVSIKSKDRTKVYLMKDDVVRFQVLVGGTHRTSLRPDCKIYVEAKDKAV